MKREGSVEEVREEREGKGRDVIACLVTAVSARSRWQGNISERSHSLSHNSVYFESF